MVDYKLKYLKYKNKYLNIKIGGSYSGNSQVAGGWNSPPTSPARGNSPVADDSDWLVQLTPTQLSYDFKDSKKWDFKREAYTRSRVPIKGLSWFEDVADHIPISDDSKLFALGHPGSDPDNLSVIKEYSSKLKKLVEELDNEVTDSFKYVEKISSDAKKSRDSIDEKLAKSSKTIFAAARKDVETMFRIEQILENAIYGSEHGNSEPLKSKIQELHKAVTKLTPKIDGSVTVLKFNSENSLNSLQILELELKKNTAKANIDSLNLHTSSFDSYFKPGVEKLRLRKEKVLTKIGEEKSVSKSEVRSDVLNSQLYRITCIDINNIELYIHKVALELDKFIGEREKLMKQVENLKGLIDKSTIDTDFDVIDDYVQRMTDSCDTIMSKTFEFAMEYFDNIKSLSSIAEDLLKFKDIMRQNPVIISRFGSDMHLLVVRAIRSIHSKDTGEISYIAFFEMKNLIDAAESLAKSLV